MSSRFLRRPLIAVCLLTVVVSLASLPSDARCQQPALISTFETSALYSYIYTPGVDPVPGVSSSMTASAVGSFWALGFGDPIVGEGLDNGGFSSDDWLELYPGYPASIFTSWAEDNRIDSCIDEATTDPDCTAILLTDVDESGTSWFKLMTAAETETRDYLFNLPDNAPIVLAPLPAPVTSGFDGSTLTVAVPVLPAGGFQLDVMCAQNVAEDVVVGYKVYRYLQLPGEPAPTERTPATDPTVITGWRPALGGVAPDGGPLPLDTAAVIDIGCQPWDVYFGIELVFDSGYEAPYLSSDTTPLVCGGCSGTDEDGDGYCPGEGGTYEDCDDTDATVFPGAPALCDDRNNDCLDPDWPVLPAGELDLDGDGFTACADCNDEDATVYPGAPEICDGQVNRCGGVLPPDEVDEDLDGFSICQGDCEPNINTIYPGAPEVCDNRNNDCDNPNWPDIAGSETTDDDGDGFTECAGDCWDFPTFGDAAGRDIYPGAPEQCDGVANDCDDPNWPDPVLEQNDEDLDGDGFSTCGGGDCDDTVDTVYPGAPEICDGLNNDCNDPDWPDPTDVESDRDGDGFAECEGDCADSNPNTYPGAPQVCDGLNNDCDDPNWPDVPADERDADLDDFPACADCDDTSPAVFPGAPQICDGLNNDCNDPNWPEVGAFELDGDGDGFISCAECDDESAAVFPGAPQICDGLNNDCNDPDWPLPTDEEADNDGDGLSACDGDCDNGNAAVFPGAPQVCDGVNNDCDDPTWPTPPADEQDNDGDGFVSCADCDDSESLTYPGAPQFCDGINNDCLNPNWPEVERVELDLDGDGFFLCAECDDGDATTYPDAPQLCDDIRNNDCRHPNWPLLDGTNEDDIDDDGITECNGDCAPLDPSVYPGAPEICDGLNNDCDDANWPTPPAEEADDDGDDFPACADCDDTDAGVFPGAPQFCDGVNNDCDSPTWPEVPASERDNDDDGFLGCDECDDSEPAVYPGAPEICDGLNNDCLDPFWPEPPDEDADNDGDGLSACDGDCDDGDIGTFPGAPQVCDGVNNDCSDPNWPALPEDEVDGDGDGSPVCADCDDADPRVYPLALQACDGINNDCLDPSYPNLEGTNEFDDDGDGFTECAGDCADFDPLRNPGAEEDCENGIDDDCDGLVDYFDRVDCVDLFVVLDAFTATAEPGGVRLGWTTSQEIDSVGFHVLRSSGGRRTERLTLQPILSRGDAVNGADYEYLDTDRLSLDNVRYWLEEIDLRGEITRFGPITVSQPAAEESSGRQRR